MTFKPYPVLTAFTVVSLVILVILGNWQYQRYADKIETWGDTGPAEGVEVTTAAFTPLTSPKQPFAQVVQGTVDGEFVWRRYVLAQMDGTDEPVFLLWDMTGGVNPVQLPISELKAGTYEVALFSRPPVRSRFSAENVPSLNTWYGWDAEAMAENLGLERAPTRVAEPLQVMVTKAGTDQFRITVNPYTSPKPADPLPPQRHFGYAITWWGLAIALFIIYLVFHHTKGRLRFRST